MTSSTTPQLPGHIRRHDVVPSSSHQLRKTALQQWRKLVAKKARGRVRLWRIGRALSQSAGARHLYAWSKLAIATTRRQRRLCARRGPKHRGLSKALVLTATYFMAWRARANYVADTFRGLSGKEHILVFILTAVFPAWRHSLQCSRLIRARAERLYRNVQEHFARGFLRDWFIEALIVRPRIIRVERRTLERMLLAWMDLVRQMSSQREGKLSYWASIRDEAFRGASRHVYDDNLVENSWFYTQIRFLPAWTSPFVRLSTFFYLLSNITSRQRELKASSVRVTALKTHYHKRRALTSMSTFWKVHHHHRIRLMWRCLSHWGTATALIADSRSRQREFFRRMMMKKLNSWRRLATRRRQAKFERLHG